MKRYSDMPNFSMSLQLLQKIKCSAPLIKLCQPKRVMFNDNGSFFKPGVNRHCRIFSRERGSWYTNKRTVLFVCIVSCFLCGVNGRFISSFLQPVKIFSGFSGFHEDISHGTDTNITLRCINNFVRNIKVFLLNLALSAVFHGYVPAGMLTGSAAKLQVFGC